MRWLVFLAVSLLLCTGALALSARRIVRFNRRRRDFCRRHQGWDQEPVAGALGREWYYCWLRRDVNVVKEVLAREGIDYANEPVIVVMGALEIPAVERARFEPATLKGPPKQSLSVLAALVTAIVLVWLFRYASALPAEEPSGWGAISPLDFVTLLAALALGLAVRFFVDRPTLLRLAPGTVKVSTCLLRESKRKTRTYPMTGGTLAIITQTPREQTLGLVRAEQSDTVRLPSLRKTAEWERIWQTLLSTATPPLSDEELVG